MTILDQLFRFPIILINMKDKFNMNERLGLTSDEDDFEILEGWAEYPYYDFIGLEDRYLPNDDALEDAKVGIFNACAVKFNGISQLLVPWSKEVFREKMEQFIKGVQEKKRSEGISMGTIKLSSEDSKKLADIIMNNEKNEE